MRAYADVESVNYDGAARSFLLTFRNGAGTARITILESIPTRVRLKVDLSYAAAASEFVVGQMLELTSMYVDADTNDVAKIRWISPSGVTTTDGIMSFQDSEVTELTLFRDSWSDHNTRGPDMRVHDFRYDDTPNSAGSVLIKQQSFATDCAEMDNVVLGVLATATPPAAPKTTPAAPADTWTPYNNYALQYYQYFAAYGYWDYAFAFYYYYAGIGQQNYYTAYGNPAFGIYSYYAGLAQYSLYAYSSYGGTLGTYYAYLYYAYAYYYYFATLGDYTNATTWFNAYYGAALALY
jgi:hypothetical protein